MKATYTVVVGCTNCYYRNEDYEIEVGRSVEDALRKASCPVCGLTRLQNGTRSAGVSSVQPE